MTRHLRAAAMTRAKRLMHKPGFEAAAREVMVYTHALLRAGETILPVLVLTEGDRVDE
jgi:hypothetical protein